MSRTRTAIAAIETDSLLSIVPGLRQLVLDQGLLPQIPKGEQVASTGARAERLVIPVSAALRLERRAPQGVAREAVGYLQRGRALCLSALLADQPFPDDAAAVDDTLVLVVEALAVRMLLAAQPDGSNDALKARSRSYARIFGNLGSVE